MSLVPSRQVLVNVLLVIGDLFEKENIKVCAKESMKGGLITGITAMIGGLLGGKTGLIAGGLLGTAAAASLAPNYKSLIDVIQDLDYDEQKRMVDTIQKALDSINIQDVAKFAIALATSSSIKQIVIRETINFVQNELSLAITSV
ncbi:protein C19orf12-like [Daktulosphaira vitifoliae]|uniref:protein C19orf12-like n=1 Tax=Daktulosphaira vitifoliae TaxID=58002 RepID=UPI0021AADD79|nr:protein C19orf12-like [Daktulosphaira vitifoliae]XP_050534644.1 protein C19orf12-like [Daktulosphaira vitifoliae]XP_050534645.1 protein C19orf12-like [Daktulosphaira vitifoliae]XP_050534646.1 protein C19orf12-like [Daktulosphaira vitifoliae]